MDDALDYVHRAIAAAPGLGAGHGPLDHTRHSLPPTTPSISARELARDSGRPTSITSAWSSCRGCDAGGRIGDGGEAEAAEPARARGDDLHHGGHADRIGAQPLGHPDLGRRLVARPQQPGRRPLPPAAPSAARATSRARARSAAIVGIRHVGKPFLARQIRPDQRIPEGEIDVIGDQHQRAAAEAPPDAAGRVGEHQGLDPELGEDPDRQRARSPRGWPSYRWKRPLCTSTGAPPSVPTTSSPLVPDHRRRAGNAGSRRRGSARRSVQPLGEQAHAARPARSRSRGRRLRGASPTAAAASSIIAVAGAGALAVAVTAGSPRSWPRGSWPACRRASPGTRAGRGRASRSGASAPMPPSWIPTELKLANPASANEAMVNDRGSSCVLHRAELRRRR